MDTDPTQRQVVDGRLYLNSSPRADELWRTDIEGSIVKGHAQRPAIRDVPADKL